jgi:hypothetical protein
MDCERGHIISSLMRSHFNEVRVISQWEQLISEDVEAKRFLEHEVKEATLTQFDAFSSSSSCTPSFPPTLERLPSNKTIVESAGGVRVSAHSESLGISPKSAKLVARCAGKWYASIRNQFTTFQLNSFFLSFTRRRATVRNRKLTPHSHAIQTTMRQRALDAKLGFIAPKVEGRITMVSVHHQGI